MGNVERRSFSYLMLDMGIYYLKERFLPAALFSSLPFRIESIMHYEPCLGKKRFVKGTAIGYLASSYK